MLDDLTLGRFEPNDSLLHRFDVRFKLVLIAVLVSCTFAMAQPAALLALSLVAAALAACSRFSWRIWWRGLLVFRWLFLFTLLLHLFFSPGRTLFGSALMSLDGLLQGVKVIWQLSLAVVFSSLLTLTSSPQSLTQGFVKLAAPLEKVRLPVKRAGDFMLLTLHFLPLLREELVVVRSLNAMRPAGLAATARHLRESLGSLLLRLVARAENMAVSLARGEPLRAFGEPEACQGLPRWQNLVFFGAVMLVPLVLLGVRLWPMYG